MDGKVVPTVVFYFFLLFSTRSVVVVGKIAVCVYFVFRLNVDRPNRNDDPSLFAGVVDPSNFFASLSVRPTPLHGMRQAEKRRRDEDEAKMGSYRLSNNVLNFS